MRHIRQVIKPIWDALDNSIWVHHYERQKPVDNCTYVQRVVHNTIAYYFTVVRRTAAQRWKAIAPRTWRAEDRELLLNRFKVMCLVGKGRWISVFEVSLVYKASSRPVKAVCQGLITKTKIEVLVLHSEISWPWVAVVTVYSHQQVNTLDTTGWHT